MGAKTIAVRIVTDPGFGQTSSFVVDVRFIDTQLDTGFDISTDMALDLVADCLSVSQCIGVAVFAS